MPEHVNQRLGYDRDMEHIRRFKERIEGDKTIPDKFRMPIVGALKFIQTTMHTCVLIVDVAEAAESDLAVAVRAGASVVSIIGRHLAESKIGKP